MSWILESKILEEMFGEKIHEKVLAKSNVVIKFLAENFKLEKKDIVLICSALVIFFFLKVFQLILIFFLFQKKKKFRKNIKQ